MNQTRSEVLQYVEENDVKFIRLAFCDIHGMQKNIAVMPDQLVKAFENGIGFDASFVRGFMNEVNSDLFLVPDPSTFTVMPWRPSHGQVVRLFCDVRTPDGTPYAGDCRFLLKSAVRDARKLGLVCKVGTACEFYLFKLDETGNPTTEPYDFGSYCDVAPNDKCENVRREICLALEEMGLRPETSRHQQGPGQNEIDFRYSDILSSADNFIAFKGAVKSIAETSGLYASFMPKPLAGYSGSSLHVSMSLSRDGENLFHLVQGRLANPVAKHFLAGVLRRITEITLFLNPLSNSYERFGRFEAPKYITWSHENHSQLIRIPSAPSGHGRMELRSTDPACNPHLAFALLLWAGLEGIQEKLPLCAPDNRDFFSATEEETADLERLPGTLGEALQVAERSEFVHNHLPEKLLLSYFDQKRREWERYRASGNAQDFEHREYFLHV